jgi:Uma2 family endonuclease
VAAPPGAAGRSATVTVLTDWTGRAEMAEREAPSELDELFELVERMQVPEGFKVEIIEGVIHVSPQRPRHWDIIRRIVQAFEDAYGMDVPVMSDVRIDFPGKDHGNGLCPDVALPTLTREVEELDNGGIRFEDVEFVAEVISKGTAGHDYMEKKRAYALGGVGVYLIVDPYTATCHLHTDPTDGKYQQEVSFDFGEEIDLRAHGLDVVLPTERFIRARHQPRQS